MRKEVSERVQTPSGSDGNDGSGDVSPTEETFVLNGRLPNGCELRFPVSIQVWQEGDEFVADSADFNLHTFGTDPEDALQNLRQYLVEHFARLEEQGDKLGPGLARDRERLRSLIIAPRA